MQTSAPLYPNLYTFLVGHAGIGKTRSVMAVRAFLAELGELHIAPTSMTMAALVDCLTEAKRYVINMPNPPMEFNSMVLMVDEWSAFMHSYDDELVAGLTTFYDVVVPYSQHRRGKEIKILIQTPQLSILAGSTPSNLLKFMPEFAWDQGFTSRILFIFSDERPLNADLFAIKTRTLPLEMVHDIKCINTLIGEFKTTPEYEAAINNWRKLGLPPVPSHPRLTHYCSRRLTHLLKLTMVASVDRGDLLVLTVEDFNRAMGWLVEAEQMMPEIFKAGAVSADAKAIEEVYHFIKVANVGKGVHEAKIVRFISERIPPHSVMRVLDLMQRSEMIKVQELDRKTGMRIFVALS